jgi:cobalt-zinc-cadmium efflux system protein
MLEDVLGWLVVLIGAVVMRFTDFALLDPALSIAVAVFIFVNAIKGLKEALDIFLEKTPHGVDVHEIEHHVSEIEGVLGVHHIHVWTMDGQSNYATMHIVTNGDPHKIKHAVREELAAHGVGHVTLELECEGEHCHEEHCHVEGNAHAGHHHHHHHHH